ncbi:MAG: hypothetical protein ABI128_04105 [Rhodanobacter sp.]
MHQRKTAVMPRKEPRTPADFAFDFLADWRPLVQVDVLRPLPDGWSLHGSVTKNGSTYALAWGFGMTAGCNAHGRLVTLTAMERSRISLAVEFRQQPGWEGVPKTPRPVSGYPFVPP